MRIGTANVYDNALEQLYKRQSDMLTQQEQLSSGLRVNRASDDPIAAAKAERALVRLSRIETDQRALETQRSALSTAEAGLGEALGRMQDLRELVIAAGNAGYSTADRTTLAHQINSLRDQIFAIANRTDSNGVPLFGGLGSAGVAVCRHSGRRPVPGRTRPARRHHHGIARRDERPGDLDGRTQRQSQLRSLAGRGQYRRCLDRYRNGGLPDPADRQTTTASPSP